MVRTSSVYDHFSIWPSRETLTFNLPKQMFQRALPLLEDNSCAKLFSNPCINVQAKAWTSSMYDHFIIWPSNVTLMFNLTEQMFQIALVLRDENNCAKLFWNPCTNVQVMVRHTHPCTMLAHTLNWSCNNYVSLTTSWLDKNEILCDLCTYNHHGCNSHDYLNLPKYSNVLN